MGKNNARNKIESTADVSELERIVISNDRSAPKRAVSIRLSEDLYKVVATKAALQRRSVANWIETLVVKDIAKGPMPGRLVSEKTGREGHAEIIESALRDMKVASPELRRKTCRPKND